LDPDINGVCRRGGTFWMISKPTKMASTKIVRAATKLSTGGLLVPYRDGLRGDYVSTRRHVKSGSVASP
jgi:hypothetical protein